MKKKLIDMLAKDGPTEEFRSALVEHLKSFMDRSLSDELCEIFTKASVKSTTIEVTTSDGVNRAVEGRIFIPTWALPPELRPDPPISGTITVGPSRGK